MFTARAITTPRRISDTTDCKGHDELGPVGERHDVRRAALVGQVVSGAPGPGLPSRMSTGAASASW